MNLGVDMAKVCEIAVIYGQLLERGKIGGFNCLDDAYEAFQSIYNDWTNSLDIENEEEVGYITAYANRVLLERYSV